MDSRIKIKVNKTSIFLVLVLLITTTCIGLNKYKKIEFSANLNDNIDKITRSFSAEHVLRGNFPNNYKKEGLEDILEFIPLINYGDVINAEQIEKSIFIDININDLYDNLIEEELEEIFMYNTYLIYALMPNIKQIDIACEKYTLMSARDYYELQLEKMK